MTLSACATCGAVHADLGSDCNAQCTKWVPAECENRHPLLLGLDEHGDVMAVSQRGTVWTFEFHAFCPRCGAEVRAQGA